MSKTAIPAMPAEATWTDAQWKAMWAGGQDILVAAAAGSGKTAVLVNRIIYKLLSEETSVDELLVVTFTKASAAEMRHRIADALDQAIKQNPSSRHLRRQLSLMNRASISTLHAFCLEVIRKYYYEIDVDPGFRTANANEAELLKDEVMDDLFEEHYGMRDNEVFFRLVDAFSSDRNDDELQTIVRSLYEFSSSHPYPEKWLDEMKAMYDINDNTEIMDLPFAENLMYDIHLQLSAAKDALETGLALTKEPGGPASRAETFVQDIATVDTLKRAAETSWDALYEVMGKMKFSTIKRTAKDLDIDKDLDDRCKNLRETAKKKLTSLQKELFSRKPESYLKDMQSLKGYVEMLAELVKQFRHKYAKEKKDRGIVDFSDLEHYCLEILTEEAEDGTIGPSYVADKYRSQFKEVLVDEYQDTNLVQETILNLVSKEGEADGNRFMVGDVKQSIYRFRLAEPNLFLGKYIRFRHDGHEGGLRIDLNKNFRSRKEVLDATNYLFKQIMGSKVGEIDYDEDAELKKGAPYPEDHSYPVEVYYIDQKGRKEAGPNGAEDKEQGEELDKAQAEARQMALLIKKMTEEKRKVTDLKTGMERSIMYRDIVVLMRSMTWAPQIMEEFKKQGIPVYANLSSGYFEATEVAIMMSLLKVIDNPLQDIPLASVLRSPIVGLDEEQLAQIKVAGKSDTFYGSLEAFCAQGENEDNKSFYSRVEQFYLQLDVWRGLAREKSLSDLIWKIYRDTKFFDYAGGMPGGKQRQANLRALFDRARQYEESSFRGLFRFLRFIERLQGRGDDLGAARALSEQEDVVRIMTIHSSKGLEFPIVLVGGTARQFNVMDLKKSYLLDKDLGFACRFTDPERRITYPSLPQIAFKKKKQLEMIAEEMRVLYVAMTRAKEKLIIIGTLTDKDKSFEKWKRVENERDWLLKDYTRAEASSYMDWISPALVRHKDNQELYGTRCKAEEIADHPSSWRIEIVDGEALQLEEAAEEDPSQDVFECIRKGLPINKSVPSEEQIKRQVDWTYRYEDAVTHMSKQSVTEIKRQMELADRDNGLDLMRGSSKLHDRPAFMQAKTMTSAEKGTIMHMVMQQIDLREEVTEAYLEQLKLHLVNKEFLRMEQLEGINNEEILYFFRTDLAGRLKRANEIKREVPFNMAIQAADAYSDWQGPDEPVLVQGVIDCLFEDEQGMVLLDYKTDRITGRFTGGFEEAEDILKERYRIQMELYAKAVESILGRKLEETYLYFFDDGGHLVKM